MALLLLFEALMLLDDARRPICASGLSGATAGACIRGLCVFGSGALARGDTGGVMACCGSVPACGSEPSCGNVLVEEDSDEEGSGADTDKQMGAAALGAGALLLLLVVAVPMAVEGVST